MPDAPLFTSWLIRCRDANAAAQLGRRLTDQIHLDRIIEDVVRTAPGGVENRQVVAHRLGDYFAAIRVLPVAGDATASRLVFERRPDAGRFWKDLMVSVVQQAEKAAETTALALDYKGDHPPTEHRRSVTAGNSMITGVVADLRSEFERLSRQVPRDPEAERAFIESKIEMIRSDLNLSKTEKERAIEELRPGLQ
jgi:hypothetical protein